MVQVGKYLMVQVTNVKLKGKLMVKPNGTDTKGYEYPMVKLMVQVPNGT